VLSAIEAVFGESSTTKYSRGGWENREKYFMHQELGDAVIHVSPGHNWLYISDADAVCDLFKRSKEFDRPPDLLGKFMLLCPL